MKYLVLLLVVGVVLALMSARRRGATDALGPRRPDTTSDRGDGSDKGAARTGAAPAPMLACRHCGLHLPREDAVLDAAGRAYCGPAHRLAGPR